MDAHTHSIFTTRLQKKKNTFKHSKKLPFHYQPSPLSKAFQKAFSHFQDFLVLR